MTVRPSQRGKSPSLFDQYIRDSKRADPRKDMNIQSIPTTIQPVKKFKLKIYPVPYIGIGQRTRNAKVIASTTYLAIRLASTNCLLASSSSPLLKLLGPGSSGSLALIVLKS